jgi:uncharacterized protein (DUF983 family)
LTKDDMLGTFVVVVVVAVAVVVVVVVEKMLNIAPWNIGPRNASTALFSTAGYSGI